MFSPVYVQMFLVLLDCFLFAHRSSWHTTRGGLSPNYTHTFNRISSCSHHHGSLATLVKVQQSKPNSRTLKVNVITSQSSTYCPLHKNLSSSSSSYKYHEMTACLVCRLCEYGANDAKELYSSNMSQESQTLTLNERGKS